MVTQPSLYLYCEGCVIICSYLWGARYIMIGSQYCICPRSSDPPFHIVSYYMKRVTTSWTSWINISSKRNTRVKSLRTEVSRFFFGWGARARNAQIWSTCPPLAFLGGPNSLGERFYAKTFNRISM